MRNMSADDPMWTNLYLFVLYCIIYAIIEFLYFTRPNTITRYKKNFARVQNVSESDVSFKMWPYGIIAYVILFFVVWYFLIYDIAISCSSPSFRVNVYAVASKATILALAIYGVYNLTNAATLRDYNFDIVILDTLWGIFAINTVALAMLTVCYVQDRASSFSFDKLKLRFWQ